MPLMTDFTAPGSELVARAVEERSVAEKSGDGTETGTTKGVIHHHIPHSQSLPSGTIVEPMSDVPLAVTRASSRTLAAMTSDQEYDSLLSQHKTLVKKRFETGLSNSEERRLQLIRWNLDCIEKAKDTQELGTLDRLAIAHEGMAAKISRTVAELDALLAAESEKHRYRKTA